jgi:predicted SAM-dependent methyltransferase
METLRMMNARVRTIARALRAGVRPLAKVLLQAQHHTLRVRAIRAEANTVRPLNVILGAGPVTIQGWLATDAAVLDVTSGRDWRRLFTPGSIDRLMAEHLFEHLSEPECATAFTECFRYLKPGGLLRIAVPDGNRKDPEYFEEIRPPKDGHQLLFTVDDLTRQLVRVGFRVTPLEYFDANEEFHCYPWVEDDGLIRRSARFDRRERFKRGTVCYTSLIVDARKP